jgi:HlyD family secretion protein
MAVKNQENGNNRKKKIIWIIASILLLTFAGVLGLMVVFSGTQRDATQPAEVIRGSIEEAVESMGAITTEPSAVLAWEMDGIAADYDLKVGDIVQKGDVLMELEANSQSAQVLQAQSALLEAQTELDKLMVSDAQFQEILKDLVYQEVILIHEYNSRDGWNYGGSTDERIEEALADYEAAEMNVWKLEDACDDVKSLEEDDPQRTAVYEALQDAVRERDILLRALSQILGHPYDLDVETDFIAYKQQEAVVAKTRVAYERYLDDTEEIKAAQAEVQALQNTVDKARIIAPFSGTVTEIFVNPGEGVSKGGSAVQIDNLDNLVVELSIPQTEINSLQIGQEARITFDAIRGREYKGVVQEIAAVGKDVDGRTVFNVTVRLLDSDANVKMGFTAHVEIITAQVEEALLIPNQALFFDNEKGATYVMLGEDELSHSKIYIETGARSDVYTEVLSGEISEGAILLINQVDGIDFQVGSGQALNAAMRLGGHR